MVVVNSCVLLHYLYDFIINIPVILYHIKIVKSCLDVYFVLGLLRDCADGYAWPVASLFAN